MPGSTPSLWDAAELSVGCSLESPPALLQMELRWVLFPVKESLRLGLWQELWKACLGLEVFGIFKAVHRCKVFQQVK